jgi:hypothetical protein
MGKSEEKRPLRKPIFRWEDDIKMDLKEISEAACTGFS